MKGIVIIPCRGPADSGEYLLKTIEHLRYPAPRLDYEIIVVDDNPTTRIDPAILEEKFPGIHILQTPGGIGCAGSRDFGVSHAPFEIADDDILAFLDAHMNPNLFQDYAPGNFLDKIAKHLAINPKRILCGKCFALDRETWYASTGDEAPVAYGAELELLGKAAIVEPRWIGADPKKLPPYFKKLYKDPLAFHIPLIHGACYGMTAGVFRYLEGFSGLVEWGSDEVYLCLKAYIAGPQEYQCGVMEDVRVGHLFDPTGPHPERCMALVLNKFRVVKELLPSHLVDPFIELIRLREPSGKEAYQQYMKEEPAIAKRRVHWEEKFSKKRIDSWLKLFEREFHSKRLEQSRASTPFLRKFTRIAHTPQQLGAFFSSTDKFRTARLAATVASGSNTNTKPPVGPGP